mgnify:CR=1 FL=1
MNDDKTRELLAKLIRAIDDAGHDYVSHSKFEAAANRLTAAEDEARLHLEALALVPDNRVDGNGIRLADLEAVDDELANKVEEPRGYRIGDVFPADPGDDRQ